MLAGASGLGTLKETIAAAKLVLEGQSSDTPLIRDLANRDDMKASQDAILKELTSGGAPVEKAQSLALERVRQTITLVKAKATPEETEALRAWLVSVAEGVAKAAREGGFLGFGGTEVSEGEQAFLAKLNTALGEGSAAAGA